MKFDVSLAGVNDTIKELKALEVRKFRESVKGITVRAGYAMEREAKENAPVKDGRLRSSINTEVLNSGYAVEVSTNVEYAPFVEYGTAAHEIMIRTKKVLSNGKVIFGKKVKHPGTRPQPFFFPAYEKLRKRFINSLKQSIKRNV